MPGEIISTVSTGKDPAMEIDKNKNDDNRLIDTDPMKTCMTRTIVPNKRPIEMRDIKKFVRRVKKADTSEVAEQENKNSKKKKAAEESPEEK